MTTPSTPSRRYMDGEARREDILNSAIDTFAQYGFRGATIKRLARAAGISEALVYRHFPSKKHLFEAVLDRLMASSAPVLGEQAARDWSQHDDTAFLRELAQRLDAHYRASPRELRLLLYSGLQGHSLSRKFFDRRVRRAYEMIIKRVRAGQKQGRYRDMNPAVAARAFLGMVNYHAMIQVLFGDRVFSGRSDELPEAFVNIFLEGLRK